MVQHLNPKDYTVAWIAVLPIEAAAALKILDGRHDGCFPSAPGDDYIYIGGHLCGHNVVIATLPAGQNYGIGPAAALVNQVRARFSNIWFALLVGVAAGLPNYCPDTPNAHRDIRLGDVLVCLPEKTGTGIIHYDLGTDTGDDFTITGRQAETPAIVRAAIGNIQLLHERPFKHGNILATFLRSLQEADYEQKYTSPDVTTDQLFGTSLSGGQPMEIKRDPRDEKERTRVWYGNIGSGNSVMRNPHRRDKLRDQYNLIGLEMEAAGIMNILPTGVIRGVCDYGDEHKTKAWQPYAAAVAAVYAKGVLNSISPKKIPKRKLKELRKTESQAPKGGLTKEDREILASLAFPQMEDRRLNIHPPHEGTCHWILDLPEYRHWDAQPCGLLWIKGKPGAGKSTLMSFIYSAIGEKLVSDTTTCLEFFFNARGNTLQHTFTGMLRSLLNQIYYQDFRTRKPAKDVYLKRQATFGHGPQAWDWQQEELKDLFQQALLTSAAERETFLFIDALDEAGEEAAWEIASYFHEINDKIIASLKTAKIYISCRHYPIASMVHGTEIFVEHHNYRDITAYVKEHIRLASSRAAAHIGSSSHESEWNELANDITLQANGVFQWVCLVLPTITKSIRNGLSPKQARLRVKEVPKELSSVYEYILRHVVDSENLQQSFLLFQWVCLAERPLDVSELRHALAASDLSPPKRGSRVVRACDTDSFVETDDLMKIQIKALSGGLLEVIDRSHNQYHTTHRPIVQVVHQTVKEFLVKQGLALLELISTETDADVHSNPRGTETSSISIEHAQRCHALLYRSCLLYIATEISDIFVDGRLRESIDPSNNNLQARSPLLKYAVEHGLNHAKKAEHCHRISLSEQFTLLNQTGQISDALEHECRLYIYGAHRAMNALHTAVASKLSDLVAYSLGTYIDINKKTSGRGFTALHFAAAHFDQEIFDSLISAKADVEIETDDGETPLLVAVKHRQIDAIRQLLALGVKVNACNNNRETALMLASTSGQKEAVLLLIEYEAHIDAQDNNGQTALMKVSVSYLVWMAQLLIDCKADMDIQDRHGWTALMRVSSSGFVRIVRVLLQNKANVHSQDRNGWTALLIAANVGYSDIVQILLRYEAKINAQDRHGWTALMRASSSGRVDTARLLLQHNADPNIRHKHGWTALMRASSGGCLKIVQMLLEQNADTKAQNKDGRTALTLASTQETKQLLLDHEARLELEKHNKDCTMTNVQTDDEMSVDESYEIL